MPPALFVLYLHLIGRPPLSTIALGIVRLAHALAAGAHPPALTKAAEALRGRAVHFAGVCPGVTLGDLHEAMPVDKATLPMIPPGLGVTWLTFLIELAQDHPERFQASTPQERWRVMLEAAMALTSAQEDLEAELGGRATDPAPAPALEGLPAELMGEVFELSFGLAAAARATAREHIPAEHLSRAVVTALLSAGVSTAINDDGKTPEQMAEALESFARRLRSGEAEQRGRAAIEQLQGGRRG